MSKTLKDDNTNPNKQLSSNNAWPELKRYVPQGAEGDAVIRDNSTQKKN